MKLSAIYTITVVVLVFLTLQGWALKNRVWSPSAVNVEEAVLLGRSADVRTPEAVQITSIVVQEGDRVEAGDVLFRVMGRGPFTLTASQDGVVTGIETTPGSFAQANETLARIVDTSADSLFVYARLGVDPEHVAKVRPGMLAVIQADYLNGGEPLDVVLTSVNPEYDTERRSVEVRFKLMEEPDSISSLLTGLPVNLEFKKTSSGSFWSRFKASDNGASSSSSASSVPAR
jgi:multidrug efflux pump subunit AcrA (membrane-fusion protein)